MANKDIVLGIKLNVDGKAADGTLKIIASDLEQITAVTKKQGDVSEASYSKTRKGLESISRQLTGAKRDIIDFFSISAASGLAKDILNTNRSMEMLRAQLTALTGSATASAASFNSFKILRSIRRSRSMALPKPSSPCKTTASNPPLR